MADHGDEKLVQYDHPEPGESAVYVPLQKDEEERVNVIQY